MHELPFQVPLPVYHPNLAAFQERLAILLRLLEHTHPFEQQLRCHQSVLALCEEALHKGDLPQAERLGFQNQLAQQQVALQALCLQHVQPAEAPAEALLLLQQCLAWGPPPPGFYRVLGQAYAGLKDWQAALQAWRQALALDPADHEAWRLSGDVLAYELNEIFEAVTAYEAYVALHDANPYVWNALGNFYYIAGRLPLALAAFERANQLLPGHSNMLGNLLFAGRLAEDYAPIAFAEHTRERVQRFRVAADLAEVSVYTHPPRPSGRPLRIGYLSSDFYNHATANYLYPLVAHHNAQAFRCYCYHSGHKQDGLTESFRETGAIFRQVNTLSEAEVAAQIFADQIDILVDLTGHQHHNSKMLALLYKPAPIQVAYITYMHTYGLPEVDYFLSTPFLSPPEEAEAYTEKLFYLPEYCAFERLWIEDLPDSAEPPMLRKGHVTFGIFHQLSKYGPRTLALWRQVLEAVPDSRLYVSRTPLDRANVAARCQEAGIPLERVEFADFSMERYAEVDFCLDALPFNSVTTAFDALLMGVPLLTLQGPGLQGRFATYFNQRVGLSDWNTTTPAEFVARAVEKAAQPDALRELRLHGRQRVFDSPFYQQRAFVRDLEAGYVKMWRRYLKQNAGAQPKI